MKTQNKNHLVETSEKELFSQIILDERDEYEEDELSSVRLKNPNRKKTNNKIRKMRS